MVMPCRLEVFGQTLWTELAQGVRGAIPDLKDFEVTIGGRFSHADTLGRLGWRVDEGGESTESETQEVDRCVEPWGLPGRLSVFFKTDEKRYVQEGGKIVKQ